MREGITFQCTECKNRNYRVDEEQEKRPRSSRTQEILQVLQSTHITQRDALINGRSDLCVLRGGAVP